MSFSPVLPGGCHYFSPHKVAEKITDFCDTAALKCTLRFCLRVLKAITKSHSNRSHSVYARTKMIVSVCLLAWLQTVFRLLLCLSVNVILWNKDLKFLYASQMVGDLGFTDNEFYRFRFLLSGKSLGLKSQAKIPLVEVRIILVLFGSGVHKIPNHTMSHWSFAPCCACNFLGFFVFF